MGEKPTKRAVDEAQQTKYDEVFFDRLIDLTYERSEALGLAFRKRLELYRLDSGPLLPHQNYLRAVDMALVDMPQERVVGIEISDRDRDADAAADDNDDKTILEKYLSYLEDEGLTDTSRSCPRELVNLLTRLVGQGGAREIYDPSCATGRLLTALVINTNADLARYVTGFGQSSKDADIFHALLRAFNTSDGLLFEKADAIQSPPSGHDQLKTFDLVVSDLSDGLDAWSFEAYETDPYHRFRFGLPSRAKGEFAMVQHMLATMRRHDGVVVVIVDQSVLLRSGKDAQVRQALIRANLLDTVIFLPKKLFRSDARRPAVLVFKASRTDANVLVINGTGDFVSSKSLNQLTTDGIHEIAVSFASRTAAAGKTLLISPEEFRGNDYAVSLNRCFPTRRTALDLDIVDLIKERKELQSQLLETSKSIDSLINSLAVQ